MDAAEHACIDAVKLHRDTEWFIFRAILTPFLFISLINAPLIEQHDLIGPKELFCFVKMAGLMPIIKI